MKKIENNFAVTGFVGKDAEIRQFSTASVARFSLAVGRNEKNGETLFTIIPEDRSSVNDYGNVVCRGIIPRYPERIPLKMLVSASEDDTTYGVWKTEPCAYNQKVVSDFLSSDIFKGVGPKKAEEFAAKYGNIFEVDYSEETEPIFDKIEQIVARNADYLALARTPQQLWDNKRAGRKSIMMGIENGLELDGDIHNIQHFKDRGIVYITLCHNGDNDICDSARGSETHGGVSAFGQEVIREMNRLGIMVDLSHAHEKSFYDALELSKTPIVCSHSSARALCDHPRNLTDDQMRALAAKGGVCQITLYHGFLKKEGEATILDAMQHLDHAIQVMGIDHVGLGTDFDGDGGIRGLANSSELTNFTRQLLARRYSDADIQKIWGGNFLRVMQQVQCNNG